eukprot:jgi/Tetstr1/437481/TSEL_026160.t1
MAAAARLPGPAGLTGSTRRAKNVARLGASLRPADPGAAHLSGPARRCTRARRRPDHLTTAALGPWLREVLQRAQLPPLHRAARAGRIDKLQELIESGAELDAGDRNGSTALMYAAEKKRVRAVELLVGAGASVAAANKWGFTALLYAAKGGDSVLSRRVLRVLMGAMRGGDAAADSPRWMRLGSTDASRRSLDDADTAGGATLGDMTVAEWVDWAATRQAEAAETWQTMLDSTDDVVVGGQVIAGASAPMMGLLDGQRYRVERLFYRPAGEFDEGEPRVDVPQLSAAPPVVPPPVGSGGWEVWAELSSEKWMPWGSTEVSVERYRLRSVGTELKGAGAVAVGVSLFWLLVLPAVVSFRFAYVPSESMAPTLHAGDLVLAEQRPKQLQEGDILMFRPPPALVRYAADNGDRLGRHDFFLKRLVGTPGRTVRVLPGGE